MSSTLIQAHNLHYAYDHASERPIPALQGVDLEIGAGEYVAVVGHNGSGKSTLAKCLNGLLLPQEGQVLVDGLDTGDDAALRAIRAKVGIVLQNPDNQFIAPSIEEELAFGPENLGLPRAELRQRVEEALAQAGLADVRDRNPHLLSTGQKARLAIASILAMRPRCLILDESTALLDPLSRAEVLALMARLHAEGLAIIAITHSMDEAALAGRVAVLDQGRLVMQGPPRDVLTQSATLEAIGLLPPSVTRIADGLRRRGLALDERIVGVEELADALLSLGGSSA
ncbi:MAG: energy-coupling factor transporter ATPase [Anaerolineae bacterium]|nr:energy-coupling factor transporter ATPase [Anaerolineae bacterium]